VVRASPTEKPKTVHYSCIGSIGLVVMWAGLAGTGTAWDRMTAPRKLRLGYCYPSP
jgi:hypothetical protein